MSSRPAFLFVTCQVGAERAVKDELARTQPEFRFSYSRPGFLTFRLPADHNLKDDFRLDSVFARAHAFSLGSAKGTNLQQLAEQTWTAAGPQEYQRVHVWPRDVVPAGLHGYEPGLTPESIAAEPMLKQGGPPAVQEQRETRVGDIVLDCVLVEPQEWWIGFHRATDVPSCWPGGLYLPSLPEEAVSRAYLKMEEAMAWSGLPIKAGQRCVEIGCAPGGASQALLARGLSVLGIDPAHVDTRVTAHPAFTHVKKRGAEVRRREFRKVRWLAADMNVAPSYTLDTVEAIVTHRDVDVRGVLLTLKLPDWKLAADVPQWVERIRGWGYADVRARQLHHNRQELCVAAQRDSV